jgi:hypothetical protein
MDPLALVSLFRKAVGPVLAALNPAPHRAARQTLPLGAATVLDQKPLSLVMVLTIWRPRRRLHLDCHETPREVLS